MRPTCPAAVSIWWAFLGGPLSYRGSAHQGCCFARDGTMRSRPQHRRRIGALRPKPLAVAGLLQNEASFVSHYFTLGALTSMMMQRGIGSVMISQRPGGIANVMTRLGHSDPLEALTMFADQNRWGECRVRLPECGHGIHSCLTRGRYRWMRRARRNPNR